MKHLTLIFLVCAWWAAQARATEAKSALEGAITISPAHGGPSRVGVPDSKPLANAEFIFENEHGTVAEFATNDAGHFRISLPPGRYAVSLKNKGPAIGRYGPFKVHVGAGQTTKVQWNCDSGMR